MAEQPDIRLTNEPSEYNLTFGRNIFSFYDYNTTGFKAGLQIWDKSLGTKIAEVQQYPNITGYYHFDLQNILQNYTTPNYSAEYITNLGDATNESYNYKLKYGWINSVGVFQQQGTLPGTGTTSNYVVFGGRKRYDNIYWNEKPYIPEINSFLSCPVISSQQIALSDYTIKKSLSGFTDGVPTYISGFTEIYHMKRRRTDDFVLTFLNGYLGTPPSECKGIKGFRIDLYNGNILQSTIYKSNITSNGGGPNSVVSGTTEPIYPYDAISIQLGYRSLSGLTSATTHYYVTSLTHRGDGICAAFDNTFCRTPISIPYRIDIIEDECNDFSPVQVSWLNSFGFRDYWFFSKRTDESVNISRETYEVVEGSWASTTFEINDYDRGNQVFNQELTITKSINTSYLSDAEAQFLKNLFISPDVRVRYDGSTDWVPIVISDTSWTERTFRKDKFFQYTLNYNEAHKIQSQRG